MSNKKNNDMYIKIQNGSPGGVTDNKGTCRKLAEYLNHEDAEREAKGLWPFPYTDPNGNEIATEEVIRMIDENARGLAQGDNKFFHIVAAPSQEEILEMGDNDQEVYRNALFLIKLLSRAYAQNFYREGVEDENDLVIFWKPHFTRGEDGYLQFHLHAIVSRKSKGVDGKKKKISPLTTHKEDIEGPIQGGFDRKAFYEAGEKLFDELFNYERKVARSFEYQNALAHGTVAEKAAQADRLALETIDQMKEAIAAKHKVKAEELSPEVEFKELKGDILQIFRSEKKPMSLYLALAAIGVTCKFDISADGVEDVSIEKGGTILSFRDMMTPEEQFALLEDITRITGKQSAEKVREERARKEMQKQVSQRKFGGPKLRR